MAFSEYLNFTVRWDIHICTYSVCTLYANYNQDIKFPYIIKIYCFKGLDSVSTAITSPVAVSQKSVWPAKLQYAMAHSRPDPPKNVKKPQIDVIVIHMVYLSFVCLLKLILLNSKPQNQMCD